MLLKLYLKKYVLPGGRESELALLLRTLSFYCFAKSPRYLVQCLADINYLISIYWRVQSANEKDWLGSGGGGQMGSWKQTKRVVLLYFPFSEWPVIQDLRIGSLPIAQAWLLLQGQDVSLKAVTAKVASALLEEATIHLIWKVRLENVLENKKVKSDSKRNRRFSRKMAVIQPVSC